MLGPTVGADTVDIAEWWENKDLDTTTRRDREFNGQRFNKCGRERKRDRSNENDERCDWRVFWEVDNKAYRGHHHPGFSNPL